MASTTNTKQTDINVGEYCYSVGSVEGVPFTACTSGSDIIILASNFQRVQLISGALYSFDGKTSVSCIDCSTDVGKIAAAYLNRIVIFEPTVMSQSQQQQTLENDPRSSLISNQSSNINQQQSSNNVNTNTTKLDYKWIQTATFEADYPISVISLNLEGTKLITGGKNIQMWHLLVYEQATLDSLILGPININGCKQQPNNRNVSDATAKQFGDTNSRDNNKSLKDGNSEDSALTKQHQRHSDSTVENHQPRARGLSIVMQHLGISGTNQLNHSSSSGNLIETAQQASQQQAKDFSHDIQLRGNSSLVDIQNAPASNSNDIKESYKMCWQCVWRCLTANAVHYIKFSPDGTLFCSAGLSDRLVKIWYESVTKSPYVVSPSSSFNPPTSPLGSRRPPPSLNPDRSSVNFSFIYIAHPRAVTGFSWRKTSKYTPRGSVANVLITSCQDNISRIWVQTLLPDDGLVNFNQLKGINDNGNMGMPRVETQRHRQKLLQRLKKMKAFSQFKKRQTLLDDSLDELEKVANDAGPIANAGLPNTLSAHDFHSYALSSTAVIPGLHFHLAGSMEAEFDFQSVVSGKNPFIDLSSQVDDHNNSHTNFVVHSINNKEIQITRSIEQLLHDMLLRILKASQVTNSPPSATESCSGSENDTDDLDDVNDTITAESGKKLRHKLCHRINKQRALAASGRTSFPDNQNDTSQDNFNSNRSSLTANFGDSGRTSPTSLVEEFDKNLESLLRRWQASADLLFNINPIDGTLTIWQVKYLDGEGPGSFRQIQIEKVSKVTSALPHYDATTMSIHMLSYSPSAYQDVKRAYLAVTGATPLSEQPPPVSTLEAPDNLSANTESIGTVGPNSGSILDTNTSSNQQQQQGVTGTTSDPNIFIVTQHLSGTLGLWKLGFGTNYPHVQNVDLVTRITGLPMHASWLCDGLLIIDYKDNSIVTRWIGDTETSGSLTPPPTAHPSRQQQQQLMDNLLVAKTSPTATNQQKILPSLAEEFPLPPSHADDSMSTAIKQEQSFQEIIRVSRMAQSLTILPLYHLKQLIELLAFGKLQRVKAILNHLVNCLTSSDPTASNFNQSIGGQGAGNSDLSGQSDSSPGPWAHRSRTLSVVAHSPPAFGGTFDLDNPTIQQQVFEEIELDYTEVISIRPLPLYSLLEADKEKSHVIDSKPITSDEFSQGFDTFMRSRSQVEETLDEILGQTTIDKLNKQKEMQRAIDESNKGYLTSFNPRKAKLLTKMLTHLHLPGLSSLDQMHLLAVADAVAAFDASPSDISDLRNDYESGANSSTHGGWDSHGVSAATTIAIDSLDDCGLRFLTAMRQHVYLTRCLPMNPRQQLKMAGIGSHNLIWAFHSETQEELISLLPCVQRNKPTWIELKEYGIGWWVRKIEVLRKLIEKVAQSAYQAKQDPLDAALFYLAMKKKTLVCALLKRVNCDKRLLKLFEQDFKDPANRKKALKNAYALLGLHRFEHAAAFFILAGSIWDAVEVCINNLNDIQLAMVLIRLHDSDLDTNIPNNLRKLLSIEILGSQRPTDLVNSSTTSLPANSNSKIIGNNNNANIPQYVYNPAKAHQDSFLRSMAFWKLGDYLTAVLTLLEIDVGRDRHRASVTSGIGLSQSASTSFSNNVGAQGSNQQRRESDAPIHPQEIPTSGNVSVSASVFNFYLYLRDQPLVCRRRQQILDEQPHDGGRISHQQRAQNMWQRDRSLSSGELISGTSDFMRSQPTDTYRATCNNIHMTQSASQLCTLTNQDTYSTEAVASYERRLFFATAHSYLDAGCPMLALEVLSRLPDKMSSSSGQTKKSSDVAVKPTPVDLGPTKAQDESKSIFSAWDPIDEIISSRRDDLEEPKFELSYDDEDNEDGEEDSKKKITTKDQHDNDTSLDSKQHQTTQEKDSGVDQKVEMNDFSELSGVDQIDFIMAQQLKFVGCMHLLLNELNTLAIGCEEDKLRIQLYIWLERSVQALSNICQYNNIVNFDATGGVVNMNNGAVTYMDNDNNNLGTINPNKAPLTRHSTIISQQQLQSSLDCHGPSSSSICDGPTTASLEHRESTGSGHLSRQVSLAAHRQATLNQQVSTTTISTTTVNAAPILTSMDPQRRAWLKSNEPILRTMLTYCNLHGATDKSLTSVRQEILLLLQEL